MSAIIRKSSISSLELASNVELFPSIVPTINLWQALSFLATNGWGKHYWNSRGVRLLGFLQRCLIKWSILKMVAHDAMGVLPICVFVICKFSPFVVQCQLIDVIASLTTSLITQPSIRSFGLCAHNHASMESSFTLFSIVSEMGPFWPWQRLACD